MFVLPCFVYPMFVLPYVLLPYVLLPSVLVTTCFSYHILFSQLSFVTTLLLLQHVLLPLSCCYYTPFVTTGFVTTFLLLPRSFCYHTLFYHIFWLPYIFVTTIFCCLMIFSVSGTNFFVPVPGPLECEGKSSSINS